MPRALACRLPVKLIGGSDLTGLRAALVRVIGLVEREQRDA